MSRVYTYDINDEFFLENLIDFFKEKKKKTKIEEAIFNLINGAECFIDYSRPKRPKKPSLPLKPNFNINRIATLGLSFPNYENEMIMYKNDLEVYKQKEEIYRCYLEKSLSLSVTIYFSLSKNPNLNPKMLEKLIEKLIGICNQIMPPETGFHVENINFKRILKRKNNSKIELSINDLGMDMTNEIIEILPDDIKEKGKEMAEVYLYLYCVENSLRIFIGKIAENAIGNDYLDKIIMNNDIKTRIRGRKSKEIKNKWLCKRGDSDLFYLDFEDLNKIIVNNWNIFKPYFPDQNWITTKIKEMADCRNLVAHNSFLDDHGIEVIKTYYTSILRQISESS